MAKSLYAFVAQKEEPSKTIATRGGKGKGFRMVET